MPLKKFIFISGFKWSGSGALYELIMENFTISEISWGQEFLPISFGLLPQLYPQDATFFRRFISVYFIDPRFSFIKVNPLKKYLIKTFVCILSLNSHWLKYYKLNINKYFINGLYNNAALVSLFKDSFIKRDSSKFCNNLLLILEHCNITEKSSNVLILDNIIPGNYITCLNTLKAFNNIKIFLVKRCLYDQVRDIKRNSVLGKFIPFFILFNKINQTYNLNDIHSENESFSFEKIILNSKYRNDILFQLSFFISRNKSLNFTNNCIINSHKNISDHCT